MFSRRLSWELGPNLLAERLRRFEASGRHLLDLTVSNPTAAGFQYDRASIREALSDVRGLAYEPLAAGLLPAREAISGYYRARGHAIEPDQVMLTASTSEAYSYLFKLLADPGDEVLAPRPSYPLFDYLAALEGVRIVQYPMFYDAGWHVDGQELSRLVSERTRAVLCVNPNNPTGTFLKRRELESIADLCERHGLALVSDEVFSDYAFAPDAERVTCAAAEASCLAFSLSGLSKVAGLPQLKLGWMSIGGRAEQRRAARDRLELIADTYLSVASPVQHALPRLLEAGWGVQQQIRERTGSNLAFVRSQLPAGCATRMLAVEGGWYATLQVPRMRTEEEWVLGLLDSEGVLVHPGYFFDFGQEGFLVLSLLTERDAFREGVARVVGAVEAG